MKRTIQLLATATCFLVSSSFAQSGGSGNGIVPQGRDVSKRMSFKVYDHNEQLVTVLFVNDHQEAVAYVYSLPAGMYWIGEKHEGGNETKRRIIVYTTTN